MNRKSLIALACLTCGLLNPVFASPAIIHDTDYTAVLRDSADGLSLLKAAQYSMLSINRELDKMQAIAVQAASGTLSHSELQELDIKFQQYKQKSQKILYKASLGESLIFNHGTFSLQKSNKEYIVDLWPKDSEALGILYDNISSISSAKAAIDHLNAASDILIKWIPQEAENNINSKSLSNTHKLNLKSKNHFDSSVLYIKTSNGAETTLQSIEATRNEIINLLTQMLTLASQATLDSTTPVERENLNTDFISIMSEINRVTRANNFSDIKAFDGSTLIVHDNTQTFRAFDLPILNIKTLGIANDDVLSNADAITAIKDLNSASDRISIWLATGTYDASYQSDRAIDTKQKK